MSTTTPTATRLTIDQAEIERAVRLLSEPDAVVEVRALDAASAKWAKPHTISGYFDDPAALAKTIAGFITRAKGIYITLEPINPALLARAANRLKDLERGDPTTADGDVVRRRWLKVDVDPVRPAEISSSHAEHQQALAIARRISTDMQAAGWPAPISGDSGNGGHLLWRIDLPVDDGGLVMQCLQALAARYNDALIHVDEKVFNPARIWKLYGTWACKGDSTADRPHRMAQLLDVPEKVEVVPEALLRALAATRPQEPAPTHRNGRRAEHIPTEFNIDAWIGQYLPEAEGPRDWSSQQGKGRKWIIPCPWNSDHTGGCAWIAELGNGAITAGCQHNGCAGNDWESLRRLKEPGYGERADRRNGHGAFTGQGAPRRTSTAPRKLDAAYRGPATWANADHDQPVEITGTAGTDGNGRIFMAIANSTTAVPLDKLSLEATSAAQGPAEADQATRPVGEIIAQLEALKPEDGSKPDRAEVEKQALDLVEECIGLSKADLSRIESTLRSLGEPQEFCRNWRSAVREAGKAAATAAREAAEEPYSGDRPSSWPYAIDERRLWLLSESTTMDGGPQINRLPIADFTARIVEEAVGEDGAKHWTLEGETAIGRTFTVEVPAADFSDERVLRGKLTQAAGPRSPVRAKMAAHLPAAIQLCSTQEPRQLRRFERTGWDDTGRFLIPGREMANTRLALHHHLPYRLDPDADLRQALPALTSLIEAMGAERGMVLLGATTIGPIARLAGWENERCALFAAGRTGTLKTSTAQTFMCIWGKDFLRDDLLIRWGMGATENAIITLATYATDLPLLIDNFKPGTGGGAKAFRNLIHAIVEGSEKARLTRAADLREPKQIATWPIFTGEDVPSDDAASIARVLVLPFDWPRGQSNAQLAQAQHQARHLSAIGRALLEWLEDDDTKEILTDAAGRFEGLRNMWAKKIVKQNVNATNPLRVASNLSTNQLTIWILSSHPTIGPVIRPYMEKHQAALESIAITMAQRTAESLEAIRFLRTLQELLATSELELAPESGRCADGSEYIKPLPERRAGWRAADGTVYLLAQNALSAVLKKLGQDALGNVSLQTLFDQIAALGLIESHGREAGRQTKVVRITADAGRPHRVLHLKAAALEPAEEEIDE